MIEKLSHITITTSQTRKYPDIAEISKLLEQDFVLFATLGYCSQELIIEKIAIACHPDCYKAELLYNNLSNANYGLFSAKAEPAIKIVMSQIKNIRLDQIMHSIKLNKNNAEIALKILLSFKYVADHKNYEIAVESMLWQFRDYNNSLQTFAADIMELIEYYNGALEIPSGDLEKWRNLYNRLEILSQNPPVRYMTSNEKNTKELEYNRQEQSMIKDLNQLVEKSLNINMPPLSYGALHESMILDKSIKASYQIKSAAADLIKEKIDTIVECFLSLSFTPSQEELRIIFTNGIIKYISAENYSDSKTALVQTAKQLIERNIYSVPQNLVSTIAQYNLQFKLDEKILNIFSNINKAINAILNSAELESASLIKNQQIYYKDFLKSVEEYFIELIEGNFTHYSEVFKADLRANLLYCLDSLVDFSKMNISCAFLRATIEPLSKEEALKKVLFSAADLKCIKSYVLTEEDVKKIIIRQDKIKVGLKEEQIDVNNLDFTPKGIIEIANIHLTEADFQIKNLQEKSIALSVLANRYLKDHYKLLNMRNKLVECYNFLLTSPQDFIDELHRDKSFYNERQYILVIVRFLSSILIVQSSLSSTWDINTEDLKEVFSL